MTQVDNRDAVQMCRNGVDKCNAHLELNLARDSKGNKKGFYGYISSKRQMRERGSLLQ